MPASIRSLGPTHPGLSHSSRSRGRWFNVSLVWFLFLAVSGCASTEKRFNKAVSLEGKGRYEEAAQYYVKVLRKDASWPEAKDRLRDSGTQVVNGSLEHAEALAEVGNFEEAVRVLNRLDGLRGSAAQVGVLLAVPDDYEEYRHGLTTGAVTSLITRGERAEQSGDWQTALRSYERASNYEISEVQRTDLLDARARVHVRWGASEMDRGYFRSAYGHAVAALEILGPDAPLSRLAMDLRDDALDAGTRRVVFLPVASARQATGSVPERFIPHLNDVLRYEHWVHPPMFVATADPAGVYQELRRYGSGRRPVSRGEAADIARALGADLVVLTDLDHFDRRESVVREQTRKAKTRGRAPADTSYIEQEFDLRYEGRIAFQVIDPHTRNVLVQGTASADASGRLDRGIYHGNIRDLDIPSSARHLFDQEAELRAEEQLEDELAGTLSVEVARRVYDAVLSGIR